MNTPHRSLRKASDRGVALLIAIFALLLVSAAAISLIVAAGTETAIESNYRTTTRAFYAASSGLEEARGRLSEGHPNTFGAFVAPFPAVLAVNQVRYVLNPSAGEVVDPTNLAPTNPYRDVEYQQEFGVPVTARAIQTTNSTSAVGGFPGPLFKWVRITAKTEQSGGIDVNGDGVIDNATPVFYDGANQNLTTTGRQVFSLTSLAVLPNGSRRLLHYDVAPLAPIPVDAAIHTQLDAVAGRALNVTGFTDAVCPLPPTNGISAGGSISVPGSGNVTGAPKDINPNAPFPYNIPALLSKLQSQSAPIDSPGTGVTGSGSPPTYSGPHAVLGVVPTVTYDGNGGITAISSPGTPAIYYSPGNLTLGTPVIGGAAPSGQGVLLVKGTLTIDITNGFNYFGLILVSGDIKITANSGMSAIANIHGTMIGGAKFDSSALSNLGGSIFIHQNACMVQNGLGNLPLSILAFREIAE